MKFGRQTNYKIIGAITTVFVFFILLQAKQVLAASQITLSDSETNITIDQNTINSWRVPQRVQDKNTITRAEFSLSDTGDRLTGLTKQDKPKYKLYKFNPGAIYNWLSLTVAPKIEAKSQEPFMKIVSGKVVDFIPPKTGKELDIHKTTYDIISDLENNSSEIDMTIIKTSPKKSLTEFNNLGIKELIGQGESNFKGSPKNRIHNIYTGVDKLEGLIINQGQEFSFNKNICPVDKSGGWLPELVIKAEGTVPEYGGGLCQVSSTVFRAVMHSGLPVTQRKNHSYAVQYYAPQGTDATTYCGAVDFKFKNDSPGSIMIWPWFKDERTLVFDIYGTKDGRITEVENAVQYDRKSDGSMKAYWNRTVTMPNGTILKDNFKSNYLPPALFHKKEELDPPTTPPTINPTEIPANDNPTPPAL